jgi:hypothetical protein
MRVLVGKLLGWAGPMFLAAACNNPRATTTSQNLGTASGDSQGMSTSGGSAGTSTSTRSVGVSDSFMPQSAGPEGGGSGGTGGMPGPPGPPYGTSTTCGDAIVGLNEECDDGDEGSDACTSGCQTRDQAAISSVSDVAVDRYLGAGRHPVSGLADGFITTYVEQAGQEPRVAATLFNIWGQPAPHVNVSEGASPIDEANPVAAALPGGQYAVAWSDFDGDGSDLGVALRGVAANGSLGALQAANAGAEFSQLNPDMIWTGKQLVIAWEDYSDAFNGPDLRYRTFDADLNPTSNDLTLAASDLPEAAVALATFEGAWAAAYREGTVDGKETIVVKVGEDSFRIGPNYGGPLDDRPALVGLDETHWLVVFAAGTVAIGSDVYDLPRLRYAVVDTASAAPPAIHALDPMDDVFTSNYQIAQLTPSVVAAAEGAYLAWRSEARSGDASGDQIWLKYLRWASHGVSSQLHGDEPELLIPRTCDGSVGDQRAPALARTQLPPGDALAIAWTDYGRTLGGGAGEPDVVVHYAPTHQTAPVGAPQTLRESWSGPNGAAWSARWSSNAAPPVSLTTQYGEGEFNAFSLPGAAFGLVNDHSARNVDIVSTIRLNYPGYAVLVARADSATNPTSYIGAQVTTKKADVWRIFSVVAGTVTNLQTLPIPSSFWEVGIGTLVDYRVRLRTVTNADGTLFVGMKAWRLGAAEPATWLLQSTLPATSPTVQALGNVAGRFGLQAYINTANGGTIYFDDFSATYFEGNVGGDLDVAASPQPLLLPRSIATYRHCNGASPCSETGGCCYGDGDCQAGLACSHYQSEGLGLGSHASVCAKSHCSDLAKSADETRADCGGPDCKACDCTSNLALGASGYCSTSCLCGQGEYPCSKHTACLPGLLCGIDTGDLFGGSFGVDACVAPHCVNRVQDADELKPDCGGSCGGGDCNPATVCPQPNGADGHCRPYCPCSNGQGICSVDDECVAPLVCGAKGTRFGFATNINVCLPATCLNNKKDAALGETSIDCGGACGCGSCPAGCF